VACSPRSRRRLVASCHSPCSASGSAEHGSAISPGSPPYFIAATLAFLGYGYWLVYRSSTRACADGEACARALPNRIVKTSLILATILILAALGLEFIAPLFLNS
jgi:hypothetical protein